MTVNGCVSSLIFGCRTPHGRLFFMRAWPCGAFPAFFYEMTVYKGINCGILMDEWPAPFQLTTLFFGTSRPMERDVPPARRRKGEGIRMNNGRPQYGNQPGNAGLCYLLQGSGGICQKKFSGRSSVPAGMMRIMRK